MRFSSAVLRVVFAYFALVAFMARTRPAIADVGTEVDLNALAAEARAGSGDALFRLAEIDDAAARYKSALAGYDDVVTRAPQSRYVPRATARGAVLRSHAEGNFVPFARLEAVRNDPARSDDPRELEALAHDADGFPAGLVRVEARMLIADAYLGRLHRRDQGMAMLQTIVTDPAADPLTARHAARLLIDARVAEGDIDGAEAVAKGLGPALDATLAKHVQTLVRRRSAHRGALADMGALLFFSGLAIAGAARRRELGPVFAVVRRSTPLVLGFAAYVALAGAALASGYETGNAAPFLSLGAVLVPLILLARAWGAAVASSPGAATSVARVLRAMVCASAAFAGGFLVLESLDTAYLASFGL